MIVGNREEAHRLALENDCAVLITGGFMCSQEIRALADEKGLPVITSTYDTFTIATMINRAISEQMIKRKSYWLKTLWCAQSGLPSHR